MEEEPEILQAHKDWANEDWNEVLISDLSDGHIEECEECPPDTYYEEDPDHGKEEEEEEEEENPDHGKEEEEEEENPDYGKEEKSTDNVGNESLESADDLLTNNLGDVKISIAQINDLIYDSISCSSAYVGPKDRRITLYPDHWVSQLYVQASEHEIFISLGSNDKSEFAANQEITIKVICEMNQKTYPIHILVPDTHKIESSEGRLEKRHTLDRPGSALTLRHLDSNRCPWSPAWVVIHKYL